MYLKKKIRAICYKKIICLLSTQQNSQQFPMNIYEYIWIEFLFHGYLGIWTLNHILAHYLIGQPLSWPIPAVHIGLLLLLCIFFLNCLFFFMGFLNFLFFLRENFLLRTLKKKKLSQEKKGYRNKKFDFMCLGVLVEEKREEIG